MQQKHPHELNVPGMAGQRLRQPPMSSRRLQVRAGPRACLYVSPRPLTYALYPSMQPGFGSVLGGVARELQSAAAKPLSSTEERAPSQVLARS